MDPKAIGEKIHGLKVYHDIVSAPEAVDLVNVFVPPYVIPFHPLNLGEIRIQVSDKLSAISTLTV